MILINPTPWNNGKSGAKLVLTSSTTPGLQIHKFDHSRTANPCDWLLCRRAALPLVGCPHSIVYLHLPVVEGLIFCISATPHLETSFPLFHGLPAKPGAMFMSSMPAVGSVPPHLSSNTALLLLFTQTRCYQPYLPCNILHLSISKYLYNQ